MWRIFYIIKKKYIDKEKKSKRSLLEAAWHIVVVVKTNDLGGKLKITRQLIISRNKIKEHDHHPSFYHVSFLIQQLCELGDYLVADRNSIAVWRLNCE
jgi:hypothetical protein